jgi:hypothetical protein
MERNAGRFMPFTPTHILAVVPIARIRWPYAPFSALVIGSIIPDLPLFVPLSPSYDTTHSILGIVTACLPLGLAGFLVFQLAMKRPLFAILPVWVQCRCAAHVTRRAELTLKGVVCASIAVMAGACTHLFWDSFTHGGRFGVELFPRLKETAVTIAGHDVLGFKVLQYGSTIVGLPCLVLILAGWLSRQTPRTLDGHPHLSTPAKAVAGLAALAVLVAVSCVTWRREHLSTYERLGRSVTTSGFALLVVMLAYCLAFAALERRDE